MFKDFDVDNDGRLVKSHKKKKKKNNQSLTKKTCQTL